MNKHQKVAIVFLAPSGEPLPPRQRKSPFPFDDYPSWMSLKAHNGWTSRVQFE
jgi:hypothetical protein